MSTEKPKVIWEAIPRLIQRLAELVVKENALVNKKLEEIQAILSEEFKEEIQTAECALNIYSLGKKALEIIWTPEVLALMKEVARHRLPIEEFLKHCSHIPPKTAKRKWRSFIGAGGKEEGVSSKVGFGRIASAMEDVDALAFRLPQNSFGKPFEIPTEKEKWSVTFLNGVNLGIPYSGLIWENPARCALAAAEERGDIAVFLTNIIDMDVKKAAGPAKVFRALISGRNINPKNLDPDYAPEAKRIIKEHPLKEMVYVGVEEHFLDSLGGWRKIAIKPSGKPEFSGKIYIVLGHREEAMIAAAAYWEAGYWTRVKQRKLEVKMSVLKRALAVATKEADEAKVDKLEEEIEKIEKERARTIVSNIDPNELKRYFKMVLAFTVKNLKEAIPNSEVIGKGTTYVKIGNEMIEINIPHNADVSDAFLSNYCLHYGPKVLRGKLASTVVVCPPYSLNYRMTVRERDKSGKRGSSQIFVAPITVDEKFLREILKDKVTLAHPISKVVNNEQFRAAVLALEYNNGMVNPIDTSIPALDTFHKKVKKGQVRIPFKDVKYIWIMVSTDPHFGSSVREIIDAGDGRQLGSSEAVIEMFRRAGLCNGAKLPIHMYAMNDDPTQGNHFQGQQQPHTEKISYPEIEKYWKRTKEKMKEAEKAGNVKDVHRILKEIEQFNLTQFWRRGEFWAQDQMLLVLESLIETNLDFWNGIVSRGVQAGLKIRGVSDFSGVLADGRDLGLINFGTGNHFKKTVNNELTEGVIYANSLRSLLRTIPKWRKKADLISKLVRAPLYSNNFIAWGTVQAPDGYEWAFDIRNSPGIMAGWGDPLLGIVRNELKRGNYNRIMDNRATVKIYGDKHFFATVSTDYAIYHMSAPDVPTDLFGEFFGGFPPNNTGVSFVGIPAKGPESGPILIRVLRYDFIRRHFEQDKYKLFDWGSFLPNPL